MSEYVIVWTSHASIRSTIEADSIEEALETSQPYATLCHACAREVDLGDDWEESGAYCDDVEVPLPSNDPPARDLEGDNP